MKKFTSIKTLEEKLNLNLFSLFDNKTFIVDNEIYILNASNVDTFVFLSEDETQAISITKYKDTFSVSLEMI